MSEIRPAPPIVPTTARELRGFRYYDLAVNAFVVVLLVSNLVAQKIVDVGPLKISAAQALFPITYIFGDIFTEVYGYAGSRRAIWVGFGASALLTLMAAVAVALPPAEGWLIQVGTDRISGQLAFEAVFQILPRAILGSLAAFWAGEFANAFVMAKMKLITSGRYLWMRTIGSTIVGQFVDTVIVMLVIFWGQWSILPTLIISGYLVKVTYEAVATPLTYLIVNRLKQAEGVDIFDKGTDFNPFHSGRAT